MTLLALEKLGKGASVAGKRFQGGSGLGEYHSTRNPIPVRELHLRKCQQREEG